MDFNEAIGYISSLGTVKLKPSLDRMTLLLERLGNPQNGIKAVHIAGTNGKGSVAAIVGSVFKANGFKTGLYISPYVTEFCERIQINGRYISKSEFADLAAAVRNVSEDVNLSQFEFITTVAFLYFNMNNCDCVVLECGLGGRFDATNTVSNVECAVITPISKDHTALLGNSAEQISWEKAGIIKQSAKVITGFQPLSALNVIRNEAKINNARLTEVDYPEYTAHRNGISVICDGTEFHLPLAGEHQAQNFALAYKTIKTVIPNVSDKVIQEGLNKVVHPARLEIISENPFVILDGAHNPSGAETLKNYLMKFCKNITVIFGGMKDKNIKEIAKILSPALKEVITVTVKDNPRALSADELFEIFSEYVPTVSAKDYETALSMVNTDCLAVCGSLYLASDIRPLLIEKFK